MLPPLPPHVRRSAVVAGAAFALLLAGCGDEPAPPRPSTTAAGATAAAPPPPPVFYVDPDNPAEEEAARLAAQGRTGDAAALREIATRPTAKWLTGEEDPVRDEVDDYLEEAQLAGQTPVLVAHNVPERDCGRQGDGGASDVVAYARWIRDLASGVNGRPVIVVLEPGAVPDAVSGCPHDVPGRLALLRDAVAVLKSTGSAQVYLDAGHPAWIGDVNALAATLREAGVGEADGFALNVANFVRTDEVVRYGHRISDALGGAARFVIDTSRNGNGPYPDATADGAPSWCNPPGRALGEEPTADPGLDRVDALLWVKYPGESDGACRPGEPEGGEWWPQYALGLVRNAR
ncbi:glycoside hydrolase family 6 protein [Micromonospora globbae]|uniref:Glucanase n=1 Tax=Micromonospora globbae TaxID=1894969 RepID=A0ABZ1S8A3_9ACTN|nr:glycoside hydrolase family 6 protein [Micromonospora globbae]